ncbi:MAG TPA: type III pantothenate kinase [Candidatus Cloacimonadota bacterium]|nr:type III pantothenate kinase [Candidatus Cloacimonadota bacterium]HQB40309.1 type III pantothenate kinase [Candidatus Cloacimonadota bacterium]
MEFNLVFDIGNTNVVAGIYKKTELKFTFRFESDTQKTPDEFYLLINSLAMEHTIDIKKANKIVICSVVPTLTRVFEQMFEKYFSCPYFFINGNTPLGLTYFTDNPSYIGADLVANAYGAWKNYNENCIVFDLGTATTIQLIDKTGLYAGVAILPGIKSGAASLFEKAAQLANIKLEKPHMLLGNNTKDALLSGLIYGHAFIIDGFIAKIKEEYKNLDNIKSIMTGGLAPLIAEFTNSVDIVDTNLTINALNLIALEKTN